MEYGKREALRGRRISGRWVACGPYRDVIKAVRFNRAPKIAYTALPSSLPGVGPYWGYESPTSDRAGFCWALLFGVLVSFGVADDRKGRPYAWFDLSRISA